MKDTHCPGCDGEGCGNPAHYSDERDTVPVHGKPKTPVRSLTRDEIDEVLVKIIEAAVDGLEHAGSAEIGDDVIKILEDEGLL